jgi:hypothetical protein
MVDKKLRSKIALEYHTGLRTSATSVIYGKITGVSMTENFTKLNVGFVYFDSNGDVIDRGAWTLSGADQINAMRETLDPLLPAPVGESEDNMIKYYTGFMSVASSEWGTDITDWEIIDDIG